MNDEAMRQLDTFLSAFINDDEDSDEDVAADLAGFGVDVEAERQEFARLLDGLVEVSQSEHWVDK